MNILLVAEEAAGIQALRALERTEHRVVAVMTNERTRTLGPTVGHVANSFGIPILPSILARDASAADWIHREQVDVLLNVHSLIVIHPAVVNAPRIGSFNLHPGPLPEYAGLNAPSWAIYHGEKRHAVTLHWMDEDIDTGPVAYTSFFDISESDTGLSVTASCVRQGTPLLTRLVKTAAANPGAIPAVSQDLGKRRYFGREVPDEGRIVWSRSGRQLVSLVRACDYLPFSSPWGQPVASLRGRELCVLKATRTSELAEHEPGTVGSIDGGAALVATGDEWILLHRVRIDDVAVTASTVLSPGDRLEDGT